MESKKDSNVANVIGSETTDGSIYDREVTTSRHITQRLRDSTDSSRQSNTTLSSEARSNSISCVTRQASGEDCAKQRFIVWAAVKRNRSVRMAVSDRLRCPLLRCGEQFDDHETMLRHLSSCQHLDAGEYLCYECMKVEKFNDGKCKCCLGHQTKRRRIINAAKKVFSTLGHKSRKDGPYESLHDGFAILPPPSYESLDLDQQTLLPLHSEISGTPINEIDGEPVLPVELGSVNYEPQNDQPQPFVENSTSLSVISPFIKPHPPFHHLHNIQTQSGSRPSLTLDTHNTIQPNKVARTTYLSPSSSFRSANSSQHIISPVSAGSGMWTYGSTIDTTLASPITPFSSDVESSSLSRENSCKFPKDHPIPSLLLDWDTNSNKANVPSEMELAQSSDDYVVHNVSELPGDIPLDMPVPRTWCNDPMLFSFEDKESYSWSSRIDTEVNVLFAGDNVHLDIEDEAFSNDTKSLVSNTWDTLKEQMICSLSNSQHVNNHLARQLGSLSLLEVALKGLACLQSILGGVDPTDPIDYLCFVHVIYAFSLVIHEEDAATRVSGLFKQALAYQGFMTAIDRNAYATVVAAIWEPTISEESNSLLGGSSSLKGKGPELRANSEIPFQFDQLINVAQNFLDDLEMTMLSENGETRSVEVMASELYTTHIAGAIPKLQPAPDAFSITVSYMVQMLSQKFGALSDTLRPKLKSVSHKVSSGYITTTRRLELELLQAGKLTLSSTELFDEYIPEVRNLCDPIYDQRASNPRTKYHRLGCSLVESMIENIVAPNAPVINSSSSAQDQSNTHDFPLDLNDDSDALAEFLKDFDNAACSLYVPSETPLGDIMRSTALASENAIENTTTVPEQTNSHSTIDPASLSRNGSDNETAHPTRKDKERASPHDYITHSPIPPLTSTPPLPELVHSPSMIDGTASVQTAAANGCCEICGYRPKGDPQWFKGSMAKHKKLQHSTDPPRIYRCMYPGCNSAYKNRADNLRQHQIEKGHFVDGETKQKKSGKRKKMDEDE